LPANRISGDPPANGDSLAPDRSNRNIDNGTFKRYDRYRMDTRTLECFVSVIDNRSIAEAARRLNLTPAGVAKRVRAPPDESRQYAAQSVGSAPLTRRQTLIGSRAGAARKFISLQDTPGGSGRASGITGALFSFACVRTQNRRWLKS
jgi:hypothetical protein